MGGMGGCSSRTDEERMGEQREEEGTAGGWESERGIRSCSATVPSKRIKGMDQGNAMWLLSENICMSLVVLSMFPRTCCGNEL